MQIFAWKFVDGQTGSGKTFTMEGNNIAQITNLEDPYSDDDRGMIPRAVSQIFKQAELLKSKGWTYTFDGNYIEIYNETLRDLLSDGETTTKKPSFHHVGPKTILTDIVEVRVTSPHQIHEMLIKASRNRAAGATLMNERSSRSHSVFTLQLSGHNELTGEDCNGRLHLVDLAGSERLNSSGATGERLKETQAINKSLSSLGDVIMSLANKDAHIPYRNSKLTYLLQNSLGGNSKTLMFVNVSPCIGSFNETVNSLRFATKVMSSFCSVGSVLSLSYIRLFSSLAKELRSEY
jgi:kinesin family protein C1